MSNVKFSIFKASLLIIFIFCNFKGQTQTLLGADSLQIKRQMLSEHAKQNKSVVEENLHIKGFYHVLFFTFPYPKKTGVIFKQFYFTRQNKCIEYDVMFRGEEWINKLKDSLNQNSTGLTQVKDSLKWISKDKTYNIYLFKGMTTGQENYSTCTFVIQESNLQFMPNPFNKKQ